MTNYISLSQLSNTIKRSINTCYPMGIWVKCEINQMNVNHSSGHCYLTLIEKDQHGNMPIAKISANIWKNNFDRIRFEFERTTNTQLRAGIEVVAFVMIDYSTIYGLSVNITKIDATFNLGQLAKQRLEFIETLKSEGIFDMSKSLIFPSLPFRVAIISSSTAAGYEDFIDHLNISKRKYPFKLKLFNCLMQGEKSPESMLNALNKIADEMDNFDCVIIIRGGGAVSDLLAFDDINVARVCAQFPLPIITGIGHTRDESILDLVSYKSLKTPTAVASFLLETIESAEKKIENEFQRLNNVVNRILERANRTLVMCSSRLPQLCQVRISTAENKVNTLSNEFKRLVDKQLIIKANNLSLISNSIKGDSLKKIELSLGAIYNLNHSLEKNTTILLKDNMVNMNIIEHKISTYDPSSILQKGFTYTEQNGKKIVSVKDVEENVDITTYFHDGTIVSVKK